MTADVLSAFLVGLLGAGHCLGMCGGIAAALSFAVDGSSTQRSLVLLAYNVGRISSYVMVGVLVGAIGAGASSVSSGLYGLRIVAGIMLVLMGFYVTGWWRVLTVLEALGAHLWRVIQPIGQRLMPVKRVPHALLLGLVWGWLPCGLVYSVLVLAMAQGQLSGSAFVMLAFGLGTLPGVLLGGVAGAGLKSLLQAPATRALMGTLVIFFGVWTLYQSVAHQGHLDHLNSSEHVQGSGYTEEKADHGPGHEGGHGAHHHHH